MHWTISTNDASARIGLDGEITIAAQASRQHGQARLFIPRRHQLWDAGVILPGGGMLVRGTDGQARFTGVADVPLWSPEGAEITVMDVTRWAGARRLLIPRTFRGVTAGCIVRRAVLDALVGLAIVPVTLGPILEAPPLIPEYTFSGQTLEDVLADLMEETGHEWALDPVTLEVCWQPSIGVWHEELLVDDGRLFADLQPGKLADRHRETIEIDAAGRSFTAWDMDVPPTWPSQTTEG